MGEDKKLDLELPGEWVLKTVLGPLLGEIGDDLKKLYSVGRNKLLDAAFKKIKNKEDGRKANLRVTRDVLWNGSFTDESICAEYFGGILASSRSEDGKDDNGVYYNDVIKSMSSKQLHLHYIIYNSFNKLFTRNKSNVNVGLSSELHKNEIYFAAAELEERIKLRIDTDLNVLFKQGLINSYKKETYTLDEKSFLPFVQVKPTTFGIILYSIAYNKFEEWRQFPTQDFGDFENITLPKYFELSLSNLISALG